MSPSLSQSKAEMGWKISLFVTAFKKPFTPTHFRRGQHLLVQLTQVFRASDVPPLVVYLLLVAVGRAMLLRQVG